MAANFSIDILTMLSDKLYFFKSQKIDFFTTLYSKKQRTKTKQSFIELKYTIFGKLNYNLY